MYTNRSEPFHRLAISEKTQSLRCRYCISPGCHQSRVQEIREDHPTSTLKNEETKEKLKDQKAIALSAIDWQTAGFPMCRSIGPHLVTSSLKNQVIDATETPQNCRIDQKKRLGLRYNRLLHAARLCIHAGKLR